jgi:hypothetical protein
LGLDLKLLEELGRKLTIELPCQVIRNFRAVSGKRVADVVALAIAGVKAVQSLERGLY